ncbi:hypothetical protein C8J56DRAFT_1162302 [Mycena floridula]|nr:hypothetical protein C8J56DRAFT_1162302 [Mycena floridula]
MSSARCYNCPNKFQQNSATESQWEQLRLLLRGNCHPYHFSSSDIPRHLHTAKDDLQRCNEEIAKQQLYLASLQKQRDILEHHVQGYESLISPIRKLPPEILRQIFILVCDENRFDMDEINIPALLLAQVCSHWYFVCFNTREIWSIITISTEESYPSLNQAVRFLLEKSNPHPLRLTIDRLGNTGLIRDLLRGLAAESDRWSELALGNVDVTLFDELVVIKSRLPILRTLILPYFEAQLFSGLDYFKVAPLLDTLELDSDEQDLDLPWAQLRNLALRLPTRPIHFLSLCPALISAELMWPSMYNTESPDIRLESTLSSLTIEINDDDLKLDCPCLSQLTLPSLDSLSIKRETGYLSWCDEVFSIARLQSLLSRSRCAITTLSWANIPTNSTEWITLLGSLNCLQSLSIEDIGRAKFGEDLVSDAFFDLLSGPTDSPFLPSLRHLSLAVMGRNSLAITPSPLIRALQIRRSRDDRCNIVGLKSFRLNLPWHLLDSQAIEPLKQLAGSGLDLMIRDKSRLSLLS